MAEFLPGYEAFGWIGFGAPKDTPPAIIDTLNKAINAAVADPTVKAHLFDLGGLRDAAEHARRIRQVHRQRYGELDQGGEIRQPQTGMRGRTMKFQRRRFLQCGGGCRRVAGSLALRRGGDLSVAADHRWSCRSPPAARPTFWRGSLPIAWARPLGQPVIIENLTGAAGSIGVGRVVHAPADGYTLSIGTLTTHVLIGGALSAAISIC